MKVRRSFAIGLALATALGVLTAVPAAAATPTCQPFAPVVIGSKEGLTVEVRPCTTPTNVASYKLTVYRHADASSSDAYPPVVIDVPTNALRVRIPKPTTPGGLVPAYTFRARAVGSGGELGYLGPVSAYAHSPFTTASAAVNELWRDVLAANPSSAQRSADVSLINRRGLFDYAWRLIQSPGGAKVTEVARLYRTVYDRVPDQAGLVYWSARHRQGRSLARIADQFLATDQYRAGHGTLTNAQFVRSTYHQAVGVDPSPSLAATWTKQLDNGSRTRGALAAAISELPRSKASQSLRVTAVTWTSDLWRRIPSQAFIDALIQQVEYETTWVALYVVTGNEFIGRVGVAGPPIINMALMPNGKVGTTYSRSPLLYPQTGTAPLTWQVTGVPAGLIVSPNGRVYGTPTEAGSYTTTFRVTDAKGLSDTRTYSYTIAP